jgi:hypothetical protein
MSLNETDIGDTLSLVNAARMAFGKEILSELPDSRPGDAADCLYYRALSDLGVTGVGSGTINFDDSRKASYIAAIWGTKCDGSTVTSPQQFQRVISRFDAHELPHYETKRKSHF